MSVTGKGCPTQQKYLEVKVGVFLEVLLMAEILCWLIGSLSHYLQGFLHPNGGCLGFLNHQQYEQGLHKFAHKPRLRNS